MQTHGDKPFDPLPYLQKTVAEAIIIIIFGDVQGPDFQEADGLADSTT